MMSQDVGYAEVHSIDGLVCSVSPELSVAAGEPLSLLLFRFNGGRLSAVLFAFDQSSYTALSTGFREKYGEPQKKSAIEYQNIFGARWDGELLTWTHGTQGIVLHEGGDKGPAWTKGDPGFAVIYDQSLFPAKVVPKDV
jgi:hypothetical protein